MPRTRRMCHVLKSSQARATARLTRYGDGWDEGERFLPDQGDVAATGLAAQRMQAEGFVVFHDHSVEALHEGSRILWAARSLSEMTPASPRSAVCCSSAATEGALTARTRSTMSSVPWEPPVMMAGPRPVWLISFRLARSPAGG